MIRADAMFGFKSKADDKSEDAAQAARPGLFKRLREKLNRGDSWLTYDLANLLPAAASTTRCSTSSRRG